MYIPHFLIQVAILTIFVISAYRAISNLSTKTLLDCLFVLIMRLYHAFV